MSEDDDSTSWSRKPRHEPLFCEDEPLSVMRYYPGD
jgi:hypothetical protein